MHGFEMFCTKVNFLKNVFVHFFEGQSDTERGRDRDREIFHLLDHSQMAATAGVSPGQRQEPGPPSGPSMRVAGAIFYCFPICISGDLARKWSHWDLNQCYHMGCLCHRQQLNPLYHNTGSQNKLLIPFFPWTFWTLLTERHQAGLRALPCFSWPLLLVGQLYMNSNWEAITGRLDPKEY